ncbi:MAG: sigma-70 family RNA polymerase sigma factor [Proteobacteria bacterium]|nr:sigma-70 family RNA polymerase sigma factor [Pseudomonadota bacterium]MDA1289893.1 sigma-70 family RNA polymerase sigma factor [Pseudomonadota bacterium]
MSTSNEPSNTEITDQELMQAVCVGSRSAYQRLVKRYLKSISHYAYRLLGNQKDTEDITQEVFLRLWTNAQKWNTEKSKLTTWLHRITHNLCIDYLRKHGRMQTQDSFDDEAADSPSTSEESNEETNDKTKLLREALSALPENQRSALSLCHYQGFSNKEAAAIMNISVKALESAIARAKRSLREKLTTNI